MGPVRSYNRIAITSHSAPRLFRSLRFPTKSSSSSTLPASEFARHVKDPILQLLATRTSGHFLAIPTARKRAGTFRRRVPLSWFAANLPTSWSCAERPSQNHISPMYAVLKLFTCLCAVCAESARKPCIVAQLRFAMISWRPYTCRVYPVGVYYMLGCVYAIGEVHIRERAYLR